MDGALVFRFPRRAVAAPLLETEARVLPAIALRLPLPVPVPAWVGRPTERFPWPFAGYRRLEGRTACGATLALDERRAAARDLGRFLAALHAIPLEGLDLPPDTIGRTDFARRRPLLVERLDDLARVGIIDDAAPWLALFDELAPRAPPPAPVCVHGDLYARHILVDDAHRAAGVIDWGDVHAGDPAVDIAIAYELLPAAARPDFERAYGPIDERTRRVARARAIFHAAAVARFAHAVGDEALRRAGREALALAIED